MLICNVRYNRSYAAHITLIDLINCIRLTIINSSYRFDIQFVRVALSRSSKNEKKKTWNMWPIYFCINFQFVSLIFFSFLSLWSATFAIRLMNFDLFDISCLNPLHCIINHCAIVHIYSSYRFGQFETKSKIKSSQFSIGHFCVFFASILGRNKKLVLLTHSTMCCSIDCDRIESNLVIDRISIDISIFLQMWWPTNDTTIFHVAFGLLNY